MGMQDMDRRLHVVIQELRDHGHTFDVVYDIGANDGRWMSGWRKHLEDSRWICMEANPKNYNKFCHLMGSDDHYFHTVLSNEDDKLVKFYSAENGDTTGDSYYKELTRNYKDEYQELTTKTLSTVIEERSLPLPDLIKMDTQGSEVDIMKGGEEAFQHAKLVLVETPVMPYNEGAPSFSDYINQMYEYGFIPTGIEHIAMRLNVVNQMDIVFVKSDINNDIAGHRGRYQGFK